MVFDIEKKPKGVVEAIAPSNIALVKYWGKKEIQIPINPSLSMSLKNSTTKTVIKWQKSNKFSFQFFFEGKRAAKFEEKLLNYFDRIKNDCPYLDSLSVEIHSENTFPHSTGIASSASAYGALSLALCCMENEFRNKKLINDEVLQRASGFARLGSGSACRSLYGSFASWGEHSNNFASEEKVHEVFHDYLDYILLIDSCPKAVSSTVGHQLMNEHPYRENRILEAQKNYLDLKNALIDGDQQKVHDITIKEAFSLHSLMSTSKDPFILMKPNTLAVLEKLMDFRKMKKIPFTFTLDAGPNIHLLFSKKDEKEMDNFIQKELLIFLENKTYIKDSIGPGARAKCL